MSVLNKNEKLFVDFVQSALRKGEKQKRIRLEKKAFSDFKIESKTKVKEFTELAIVLYCREIIRKKLDTYATYNEIVNLYENQANLSFRTSRSMLLQQYSTPAPIAFLASTYVKGKAHKAAKSPVFFEPSAGNGLLTIDLPENQTIVNEIDDIRLQNLKTQNFAKVLSQNATKTFKGYLKKFKGVVTNPPFGTLSEAVDYDGYKIKTLEHLMALRALDTMKDNGRAAIIIGGHTTWDERGRIKAGKNRLFFNYLYSHYHVQDVILIDGNKLYSRQGTSFDVRMILIDGRKKEVSGAAPLRSRKTETIINDFNKLYNRVLFSLKFDIKKIRKKIKLLESLKA